MNEMEKGSLRCTQNNLWMYNYQNYNSAFV